MSANAGGHPGARWLSNEKEDGGNRIAKSYLWIAFPSRRNKTLGITRTGGSATSDLFIVFERAPNNVMIGVREAELFLLTSQILEHILWSSLW